MVLQPFIENVLSLRFDFIRVIIFILIARDWSLIRSMLWLMLSNTADKASRTSITSSCCVIL